MSSKNFYGLTGDVTVDGGILNVGNAQLYANTGTSNVGIGTSNPEFELDVHGNANVGVLYSTFLYGDGSNIQNIVSSQWEGSPGDPIYYANNVGIANTSPVTKTLQVGSNLYMEDTGSNVLHVTGNIYADYFVGDGSQLTGIAASLDQIVDQGNTVSNTIQIVSGQDTTSNVGLVTWEGVGISVSNTNPTGEYQFGVGSNLLVNVYSSNVMTVDGNVFAQKMTLGTVTITPAYNLQQITETGATSNQTLVLSNVTTGLTADANIVVDGNVTAGSVITSGNVNAGNVITSTNINVGGDLSVTGNVYVNDMRVAEVASNLVTYDSTTGELLDSGGLFSNKLAVVSEQPPIALTGASTAVTSHGTYTIEASSTSSDSSIQYLFDKDDQTVWKTDNDPLKYTDGGVYDANASLADIDGEWAKITMPYKTILRHVKIESTNRSIKDVTLVGLNADGLTWTSLKTVNGLNEETSTIVVNATTHHRTYGLIVRATNSGATQAEIGDLKLFTESFSIDGGKVAMASSAVMGGETTVEQSGPHSRLPKAMPLRKFPEIVFEEGKFDKNDTTNTYTQAGYTVSASSQNNTTTNAAYGAFDSVSNDINARWRTENLYVDNSSTASPSVLDSSSPQTQLDTNTSIGEYLILNIPKKIKLKNIVVNAPHMHMPYEVDIYGRNEGVSTWTHVKNYTYTIPTGTDNTVYNTTNQTIDATEYYSEYAFVVVKTNGHAGASISELELYGYEEDPPLGDTSVDTTFTSIMNTPQTTGANVYIDGNLGETFTNRVTGPDATGTATTYDSTGKYWELTGALTSNVTLEANTFLEGDQPHAVSVWFNSSNLEANVSNTCVFSISDQEKLDSVNLDLQSNTWHNLTYAYQGEGGSRVTYLDGRKVAEDQAEDTFGEYPPFAMTGYSQGGYVVSSSNQSGTNYESWRVFDDTNYGWETATGRYNTSSPYTHTAGVTTVTDVSSRVGDYIQLDLPYKIQVDYFDFTAQNFSFHRSPHTGVLAGSNDGGVTWTEVKFFDVTVDGSPTSYSASGVTTFSGFNPGFYKSFRLIWLTLGTGSNNNRAACEELKLYGHRENDLVRLPDPTNVLKYPHIAMTGPAQRGYVVSAKNFNAGREPWEAFNGYVYGTHPTHDNDNGWMSGGLEFTNSTGAYNQNGDTFTDTASGTHTGPWIRLETPHKLQLSSFDISNGNNTERRMKSIVILGSDDASVSTGWSLIYTNTNITNAQNVNGLVVNSTQAFKYHMIVTKAVSGGGSGSTSVWVAELQFYGTEEASSIPIQIGGGNIDKVANFRVYDKFIDENQALEIWDAQKDAFGRAKSSMTLHKGRLGIGTTEPEGRLAVLDEPHNLEEFPPRAMTGYETHVEGHGVFKASASTEQNTTTTLGWHVFAKISDNNINKRWRSNSSVYDNTVNPATTNSATATFDGIGVRGEWILLEMPYNICLKKYEFVGFLTQTPHTGQIWGSDDNGTTWHHIDTFENAVGVTSYPSPTNAFHVLGNTKYYSKYVFIVEKLTSADDAVSMSSLKFFGTREQGQSVLHDGQLTLTKNLNVPRIGPALDADDTPRRDRLVVEYNTSTNPTFEGAVRDTSGRGNDGVFYGTNMNYSSTDKAFVFNGTDDYIKTESGVSGNQSHTVSLWFNPDVVDANQNMLVFISSSGGTDLGRSIIYFNTSLGTAFDFRSKSIISATLPVVGQWMHLVCTYDSSNGTTKMYMDGVLKTDITEVAAATTINLINGSLTIGSNHSGNEEFEGKISNFKMYVGHALTAQEVKTLYDMGRCDEGHHVVNFSKTRVGIGLGDGEVPRSLLDVGGEPVGPGSRPSFLVSKKSGSFRAWGSSNGTHTTEYSSPLPIFREDELYYNIGNCLSFGDYAGRKYIKFTAPADGIYNFGLAIGLLENIHTAADYIGLGLKVNVEGAYATGSGSALTELDYYLEEIKDEMYPANGYKTVNATINIKLLKGDFVVYYSRSVENSEIEQSYSAWGNIVHYL